MAEPLTPENRGLPTSQRKASKWKMNHTACSTSCSRTARCIYSSRFALDSQVFIPTLPTPHRPTHSFITLLLHSSESVILVPLPSIIRFSLFTLQRSWVRSACASLSWCNIVIALSVRFKLSTARPRPRKDQGGTSNTSAHRPKFATWSVLLSLFNVERIVFTSFSVATVWSGKPKNRSHTWNTRRFKRESATWNIKHSPFPTSPPQSSTISLQSASVVCAGLCPFPSRSDVSSHNGQSPPTFRSTPNPPPWPKRSSPNFAKRTGTTSSIWITGKVEEEESGTEIKFYSQWQLWSWFWLWGYQRFWLQFSDWWRVWLWLWCRYWRHEYWANDARVWRRRSDIIQSLRWNQRNDGGGAGKMGGVRFLSRGWNFDVDVCWLYFDRFCSFTVRQSRKENPSSPLIRIMQDPHRALKMCGPSYFKTYLFWRVKHSRIKKESSITTRWKILSMVYARLAEEYMKEGVLYDMRNVLCLSPPS